MSILRFFQPDPTREWPACRAVPLTFDAARAELNGLPLGAPLEALRPLGRPSNPRPLRKRECEYAPLGLEVGLGASDRVYFFGCIFQPVAAISELIGHAGFRPCDLTLQLADGALATITSRTTAAELEQYLGPLVRDDSGDGPPHSATLGSTCLSFGFDPAGHLMYMDIEPAPDAS